MYSYECIKYIATLLTSSLSSISFPILLLPFPSLLPSPLPSCLVQKSSKKPTSRQQCSAPLAASHLEHLDLSGCHLITNVGLRYVSGYPKVFSLGLQILIVDVPRRLLKGYLLVY